ncbi:alpha-amylase family glycosyl hydrolase [Flammeovirgaceae bacterium SG7u.111]|nr:alpha-amylase family glycosyl hydrolase [Flammeovirgaceae bacterium SG7u.132]WPO37291.1 alpha-amylase family glycosyl hydrolase [Flammeovirgaceae bacterium SG7u.111]
MNPTDFGVSFSGVSPTEITIRAFLPNITSDKGYRLFADIIHSNDQFKEAIPAFPMELINVDQAKGIWEYKNAFQENPAYGELGKAGKYIYRFRLLKNNVVKCRSFSDPFSKESGTGTYSSFSYKTDEEFTWTDASFTPPNVNDLVIYEMMVDDFAHDFSGVLEKIEYLKSLHINCIELMPVTNIPEPYRWGYMPMSYFAIEERYGGQTGLKEFVNECHKNGIAVIHDAVYSHMHDEFCYKKVYWEVGEENPMIGPFAEDMFGVGTDFNKSFTFEYFLAVNKYFMEEFHMDGFRYDYVPGIYDGPMGIGYAKLVYETYQYSKTIPKFQNAQHSKIIQAAEYLSRPKEILETTYTSASKRWEPMLLSQDMIKNYGQVPRAFVDEMLLIDFNHNWPSNYDNGMDEFPVAPIQFIECHDKSRLMYLLSGQHSSYHGGFDLFGRDISKWYRLQPFAIALLTSEGIPMIWQGQEFGEIYGKHDDGGSRVLAARPLHWNYFYEESGRTLVNLYRKLGKLRQELPALRSRFSYFYDKESRLYDGLVAFLRIKDQNYSTGNVLVLINFSEGNKELSLYLRKGTWIEQLNKDGETLEVVSDYEWVTLSVPSNFGKVFVQS